MMKVRFQRQRRENCLFSDEEALWRQALFRGQNHMHHVALVWSDPSTLSLGHPSMKASQGSKKQAPRAASKRIRNASSAVPDLRIFCEFSRPRPHRTVTVVWGPKPFWKFGTSNAPLRGERSAMGLGLPKGGIGGHGSCPPRPPRMFTNELSDSVVSSGARSTTRVAPLQRDSRARKELPARLKTRGRMERA